MSLLLHKQGSCVSHVVTVGYVKVQRLGGLQWHNVHTKFRKNRSVDWKMERAIKRPVPAILVQICYSFAVTRVAPVTLERFTSTRVSQKVTGL